MYVIAETDDNNEIAQLVDQYTKTAHWHGVTHNQTYYKTLADLPFKMDDRTLNCHRPIAVLTSSTSSSRRGQPVRKQL